MHSYSTIRYPSPHFSRVLSGFTAWLVFLCLYSQAQSAEPHTKNLYFAAVNIGNPFQTFSEFQPLIEYLNTETGLAIELYIGKDYQDVVFALRDNKAQLGFLGSVIYLQARKYLGVVPLVQPVDKNGLPLYQSICIAHKSSKVELLEKISGKSVCCGSRFSTSGYWVPRHMVQKSSSASEKLVCSEHLRSHYEIMKSVLKGSCEIGFIKDIALHHQPYADFNIIQTSDPIPSYPIVAVKELPDSLKQVITNALVKMDAAVIKKLPFHEQLSKEFINGFTRSSDSDFDTLRNIVKHLEGDTWPDILKLP